MCVFANLFPQPLFGYVDFMRPQVPLWADVCVYTVFVLYCDVSFFNVDFI